MPIKWSGLRVVEAMDMAEEYVSQAISNKFSERLIVGHQVIDSPGHHQLSQGKSRVDCKHKVSFPGTNSPVDLSLYH